jgi:CRP-like cAMP-binding protein
VVEGCVKILRETQDGSEVILRLVRPGEPFSMVGIGMEPVERSSAQAHDDTIVLEIPTWEFIHLLRGSSSGTRATLEAFGTLRRDAE